MIHQGDNLQVMAKLYQELGPIVTLAYLDPPYNTSPEAIRVATERLGYAEAG